MRAGLFAEFDLPDVLDMHAEQADLRYIGRDALAVLLGLAGDGAAACDAACVLDVRRNDERALYGSIPGASGVLSSCSLLEPSLRCLAKSVWLHSRVHVGQ